MTVMVTGGAGYIGSHAVLRLLRDGQRVVAVDNLFRGHREAIERLQTVADGRLTFVPADVGDGPLMARLLAEHKVKTVMHFAAMAYVGESVTQPLRYYRNNTGATLALLEAIQQSWMDSSAGGGVEKLVFSSTCASYGEPPKQFIPIPETCPQQPVNPYGWSKLFCELMMRDFAAQAWRDKRAFSWAALRYFNVAGSDSSGLIGEHHEPETHLIPVCLQVVLGQREALSIHGTDYPTPDGTCIRDYVHVEDLIDAHVTVMKALNPGEHRFYNLGIGNGLSVRQIIDSVKRVTGKDFKVIEGPRRPGDPPELFADPRKIAADLNWKARITDPDKIVSTAWNWFQKHPRGYSKS
ncbi:MAG TPA: UDP-glucose 4-epimerase GalE [Phycisphaerales bacterium]|nr:UDP-glucose 4-epimerase GalE [Phycisphaerales bacterium]